MLERESLAIPSKETNRTVAELREILDVYLCHAEELGIVDRRPREFDLTVKTKFDELLDGVVKDEGAALADSALRFLEEAGRRAIPMRASEDGVFRAEEKKVAAG